MTVTTALLLLMLSPLPSEGQDSISPQPMNIEGDFSVFRGQDDTTMYVEIYYSIPVGSLSYHDEAGQRKGEAIVSLMISSGDDVIIGQRWRVPKILADSSDLRKGLTMVGVYPVSLSAGAYSLFMIAQDMKDSARVDTFETSLNVRKLSADKIAMSDLELASQLSQGAKGSPFYKNTLEVIPSVNRMFNEDQVCYLYAEAYSLTSGTDKSDFYVKTAVVDAVGTEVIARERARKRTAESMVLVDNVVAGKLRTGTYTAYIVLMDTAKTVLASSGKKFFVYNPTLGVDTTLGERGGRSLSQEYVGYSEASLDTEFDQARYEAKAGERTEYEQLLGVDAKRRFLANFWGARPLGFREMYMGRVAYTNGSFRSMGRDGYKADRGRVYITYGPPDDIERHPNDPNMRPYEIWTFEQIQGGVIFVFLQRSGSGSDFELVHSTHRNEIRDESWIRQGSMN